MEKGRFNGKKRYILLFILGMLIFIYPAFANLYYVYVTSRSAIAEISTPAETQQGSAAGADKEKASTVSIVSEKEFEQIESDPNMTAILKKDQKFIESYNNTLLNSNSPVTDPLGDNSSDTSFVVASGDDSSVFAYIDIPKINQKLPIYLGATDDNLDLGIAVIQGTSIPIGGVNTNSVIAGHTGDFEKYFSDITQLEPGDEISITNRWETLHYRVTGNKVIFPNQEEYLAVVPGKDLITLLTCYLVSPEDDRILVFAERYYPQNTAAVQQQTTAVTQNKTTAGTQQAKTAQNTEQNAELKTNPGSYSYLENVEVKVKQWYEKPQTYLTAGAVLLAGLFLYTLFRKNKKAKT